MDYENKIVDYLANNELKLAIVTKQQKDKLQAVGVSGRNERVNPKQILLVHGSGNVQDFPRQAEEIQARIDEALAELDTELLWDSFQENREELGIECLAEEYFGEATAAEKAALGRAIFADPLRFKRKGLCFHTRSADEVEQQLIKQQRDEEKAALRERVLSWAKAVLKQQEPSTIPEDLQDFMGLVKGFLLQGQNNEAARILEDVFPNKSAREVSVELLRQTDLLPEDADPFLLVNGVLAGFSEKVEAHAQELPHFAPGPEHKDLSHLTAFSIDDEETREVDDALSVEQDGENLIVGIHIADPATFVKRDDPLDRAALNRPLTLYLPSTTVTMLPHRIGCDLASLKQDQLRPAISFRVVFGPDGEIQDWTFERAQVKVAFRLTYEQAESLLDEAEDALGAQLRMLQKLTDGLRQKRLDNGALQLKRPEFKVKIHHGEISVKQIDSDTPARQIVSELMVLANHLAAKYALTNDIPIIYRSQEAPHDPIEPMEVYNPLVFERNVRTLKKTRLTTHPQPHAGLGLDIYTQASSPIRRFADLVIQRQLTAHLAGEPCPYNDLELIEILGTADAVTSQNRRLEREAIRYWLLEYLRCQDGNATYAATVVNSPGRNVMAELDEYGVRGTLQGGSFKPGDQITVKVAKVDPQRDQLVLSC
jgi:exoribonuclease-2